jgi:thiol-disulfide isomerase/thioredoxin
MKYAAFIFITLLVSCATSTKKAEDKIQLSDIRLTDLDGREVLLNDEPGQSVFINFWATWCRPCLAEMPSIDRLQNKLEGEKILFIFASDEEPEKIKQFLSERKIKGRFLRVENPEELNIQALPTTFIYNAKGEMIFSEAGFRQWDEPSTVEMVKRIINP